MSRAFQSKARATFQIRFSLSQGKKRHISGPEGTNAAPASEKEAFPSALPDSKGPGADKVTFKLSGHCQAESLNRPEGMESLQKQKLGRIE